MKEGRVFTLDELSKADNKELKFTKNEAKEWINIKIKKMAKGKISSGKVVKDENPISCIAKHIYECLVDDWTYNNKVLEASRAVGLDEAYVLDVIAPLFDSEGNPIQMEHENMPEQADNVKTMEEPRPYYASMITLDEAHDKLDKARKPGSKDIKKRKSRAAMRAASRRAYESGYFGPGSKGRMSRYAYKPKKGGE
jgi:hypothetical protein